MSKLDTIITVRFRPGELETLEALQEVYAAWAEADGMEPPTRSDVIRACVRQMTHLMAAVAKKGDRQALMDASASAMLEHGGAVRNDWSQGAKDGPAQ